MYYPCYYPKTIWGHDNVLTIGTFASLQRALMSLWRLVQNVVNIVMIRKSSLPLEASSRLLVKHSIQSHLGHSSKCSGGTLKMPKRCVIGTRGLKKLWMNWRRMVLSALMMISSKARIICVPFLRARSNLAMLYSCCHLMVPNSTETKPRTAGFTSGSSSTIRLTISTKKKKFLLADSSWAQMN